MQLLGVFRLRSGCGFQYDLELSNSARSRIASFEHGLGERAAVHMLELAADR